MRDWDSWCTPVAAVHTCTFASTPVRSTAYTCEHPPGQVLGCRLQQLSTTAGTLALRAAAPSTASGANLAGLRTKRTSVMLRSAGPSYCEKAKGPTPSLKAPMPTGLQPGPLRQRWACKVHTMVKSQLASAGCDGEPQWAHVDRALMGPSTTSPHSAGVASVLGASDVEADALRTVPRHGAPCSTAANSPLLPHQQRRFHWVGHLGFKVVVVHLLLRRVKVPCSGACAQISLAGSSKACTVEGCAASGRAALAATALPSSVATAGELCGICTGMLARCRVAAAAQRGCLGRQLARSTWGAVYSPAKKVRLRH